MDSCLLLCLSQLFVTAYFDRCIKPNFILDDQYDEEDWYELEFDEREDYNVFFSSMSNETMHLSQLLCEKYPQVMVSFLQEKLKQLIDDMTYFESRVPQMSIADRKSMFLTLKSRHHALQHIFQTSFVSAISALKELKQPSAVGQAMPIVELLWYWQPKGCFGFKQRLRYLASCFAIFKEIQDPLFALLELLFSIVNCPPKEKVSQELDISADYLAPNQQYLIAEGREDAATALSLLIKNCPELISSEEVWMKLLTTVRVLVSFWSKLCVILVTRQFVFSQVTGILQGGNQSVGVQDAMREALVVLSMFSNNPQLCRDLLDVVFKDQLSKVADIVREVFVSPEMILQAVITPLSDVNPEAEIVQLKSQLTTVFLDRANRLRTQLQTFLHCANMVETTAISTCGENLWRSPSTTTTVGSTKSSKTIPHGKLNEQSIGAFSVAEMKSSFPLSIYWHEMLRLVIPALQVFQEVWSPKIFQLLNSNASYESVKLSIYGVSFVEGCKKCKLPNPLEDAPSNVRVESILKDQINNLFSTLFKTLGLAAKQFVLLPLLMEGELNIDTIVLNAKFMEHSHFTHFVKYTMEPLVLHTIPYAQSFVVQMLQFVVQGLQQRLQMAWSVDGSSDSDQQLQLLYSHCYIFSAQFSADQIQMIREAVVREVSQCISDSVGCCLALKGLLAIKSDLSDKTVPFSVERRQLMWSIFFGSDSKVMVQSMQSLILTLLSVPDGSCCRQALVIADAVLKRSETDKSLVSFVATDCFRTILKLLIQMVSPFLIYLFIYLFLGAVLHIPFMKLSGLIPLGTLVTGL
jgi:hypothetical protein